MIQINLSLLGFIIFAYLLGSVSGAIILSRLLHLSDPRSTGSNNPGATNMVRLHGTKVGIMVLVIDILKGMIPVYLAYRFQLPAVYLGVIAIAVCLGHIFPCFFHFRGGKGVATAFGALLLISASSSATILLTWAIALLLFGYVSIATMITCLFSPFIVWLIRPEFTIPVAMLSVLILLRHLINLTRLMNHAEPKLILFRIKAKSKIHE